MYFCSLKFKLYILLSQLVAFTVIFNDEPTFNPIFFITFYWMYVKPKELWSFSQKLTRSLEKHYLEIEENRKNWFNTLNNLPQGAIKLIRGKVTFANKAC